MPKPNPPKILRVGPDGSIQLPKEALDLIDVEPGGQIKLFIDARRTQLRVERHVDDAWADALQQKEQPGMEDLIAEQEKREADAGKLFDERMKDPPKVDKRKPEDNPDYWR